MIALSQTNVQFGKKRFETKMFSIWQKKCDKHLDTTRGLKQWEMEPGKSCTNMDTTPCCAPLGSTSLFVSSAILWLAKASRHSCTTRCRHPSCNGAFTVYLIYRRICEPTSFTPYIVTLWICCFPSLQTMLPVLRLTIIEYINNAMLTLLTISFG